MSGQFLRNLLLFGRVLRKLGLDVNPGRVMDLVSALDHKAHDLIGRVHNAESICCLRVVRLVKTLV